MAETPISSRFRCVESRRECAQERLERRIGELEDELKIAKERIDSLKSDLDAQVKLVAEMDEHLDEEREVRESWCDAFDMVLNDKGEWDYNDWTKRQCDFYGRYDQIRKDWNKFVPEYNAVVVPRRRNFGRPLQASDKQREDVLRLRKEGMSLRDIADETNLGLSTIRTIVDKKDRVDRATMARLERIAPDMLAAARERRQQRLRVALPKRLKSVAERNDELRKEARGLRGRG
jgi:hypothetical protein